MYYVYILYSADFNKSYVGYSQNIERRMREHNFTETQGFTLRYRPWVLIYTETLETKTDALKREKYYKSGVGRVKLKEIIGHYLQTKED